MPLAISELADLRIELAEAKWETGGEHLQGCEHFPNLPAGHGEDQFIISPVGFSIGGRNVPIGFILSFDRICFPQRAH